MSLKKRQVDHLLNLGPLHAGCLLQLSPVLGKQVGVHDLELVALDPPGHVRVPVVLEESPQKVPEDQSSSAGLLQVREHLTDVKRRQDWLGRVMRPRTEGEVERPVLLMTDVCDY